MKISILTPDVSNNCFGRAWLLANLLKKHFDIEVIGPDFDKGIWKPIRNQCDFKLKIVKGFHNGRFEFKKILNLISGNIIYASKPLMASFGVGIVKKIKSSVPLILDIDDWEVGYGKNFVDNFIWPKKIIDCVLSMSNWRSYYYSVILDKLIKYANDITVSGKVLQQKYGGKIIWHGRDTNFFNPKKYDKINLKGKYLPKKFKNHTIFSFLGTPRPHKGVEDLINALKILRKDKIALMIFGSDSDEYCIRLKQLVKKYRLQDKIIWLKEQSFKKLPEFLSISDIIVIPQIKRSASVGQVPAKIFDGMAMAKPIIATNIPEIKDIINGCARIVEPENPIAIAREIRWLSNNTKEALELGKCARERCKYQFSWRKMEEKLIPLFENVKCKNLQISSL